MTVQESGSRGRAPTAALCLGLLFGMGGPAVAAEPVFVSIANHGCEPGALTVAAGRTVFKVKNASGRVVEWEILKGVTVVEERENIVPGFTQTVTATLEPGDYQITCGLKSNPRGTLKVVAR